jgi:hypothetical protein
MFRFAGQRPARYAKDQPLQPSRKLYLQILSVTPSNRLQIFTYADASAIIHGIDLYHAMTWPELSYVACNPKGEVVGYILAKMQVHPAVRSSTVRGKVLLIICFTPCIVLLSFHLFARCFNSLHSLHDAIIVQLRYDYAGTKRTPRSHRDTLPRSRCSGVIGGWD